jgi:hypothetical protein
MKTTIGALRGALNKVLKAVRCNTVRLVLKDERLCIAGTGRSDGSAKASLAVEAGDAFDTTIRAGHLCAILGTADSSLSCELVSASGGVRIKFAGSNLLLKRAEDVDVLLKDSLWKKAVPIGPAVKADVLKAALARVTPFAAQHDVRYYLIGVCFAAANGVLALSATDGYRAAQLHSTLEVNAFDELILPLGIAEAIGSVFDAGQEVTISILGEADSRGIGFRSESFELLCPVVAGKFPNLKRALPPLDKLVKAEVATAEALAAIERIGAVAEATNGSTFMRVAIRGEQMQLQTVDEESTDTIAARIELKNASAMLETGFQPRLLASGFANVGTTTTAVYFTTDDSSPKVMLRDSGDGAADWFVLMSSARV